MAQTIAIERVDHIGIRVRDLERALAFYRALGFTLAHRAAGDDVAIVCTEHGVELKLIFNANAGDPDSQGERYRRGRSVLAKAGKSRSLYATLIAT